MEGGRRRRLRGHRLLRVLRAGDAPAGRGRGRAVAAGRSQPLQYQPRGVGGRDRALELPARHPDRDGHRRAGDRQHRVLQARRADARSSATRSYEALHGGRAAAGCASHFLPGIGEEVGRRTWSSTPTWPSSTFTGSQAVGLDIVERAAVHRPGPAPREAGGRGDGGQEPVGRRRRCRSRPSRPRRGVLARSATRARSARPASRLIVVDAVHDEVVERLIGATRVLRIGHPRHMGTQVGPAHRRRCARAGVGVRRCRPVRRNGGCSRATTCPTRGSSWGPRS